MDVTDRNSSAQREHNLSKDLMSIASLQFPVTGFCSCGSFLFTIMHAIARCTSQIRTDSRTSSLILTSNIRIDTQCTSKIIPHQQGPIRKMPCRL